MNKTCIGCKETKPTGSFPSRGKTSSGVGSYCNVCMVVKSKSWRDALKAGDPLLYSANNRKRHLRDKFGISPEEERNMFIAQEGRCAICHKSFECDEHFKSSHHIDHNKEFNFIRELLCENCNRGLGMFMEDVDFLQAAIDYLHKHEI